MVIGTRVRLFLVYKLILKPNICAGLVWSPGSQVAHLTWVLFSHRRDVRPVSHRSSLLRLLPCQWTDPPSFGLMSLDLAY